MLALQERIRPSADLRNHYNEISKQCREDKEAVIITVNGRGDTVSLSYEEYKRMKARIELLEILAEAEDDVKEALLTIKKVGVKAGLSIKPDTDPARIQPFLDILDLVLVMTVQPGFGGQSFLPSSPAQIKAVRELIDQSGRSIFLEVDGGINAQTAREAALAGANAFVAGNAIFAAQDKAQALHEIRKSATI